MNQALNGLDKVLWPFKSVSVEQALCLQGIIEDNFKANSWDPSRSSRHDLHRKLVLDEAAVVRHVEVGCQAVASCPACRCLCVCVCVCVCFVCICVYELVCVRESVCVCVCVCVRVLTHTLFRSTGVPDAQSPEGRPEQALGKSSWADQEEEQDQPYDFAGFVRLPLGITRF
jgi:hypothetical protein